MAGSYGWNSRNGNVHGFNQPRPRSYGTARIACRLCDHVFSSTQALINHIESHMMEEEAAASRRRQNDTSLTSYQRDPFANSIQPNFALPTPLREPPRPPIQSGYSGLAQERNPNFNVTHMVVPPPNPPPQVIPLARNNNYNVGTQEPIQYVEQAQPRVMEELPTHPSDCTKPYLGQLEQPIPAIVVVDGDDDSHGNSGSNKMDLTLKL